MRDEEDTPVGESVCRGCGETTDVYVDDAGLRCDDCRGESSTHTYDTYTPTLVDWTDEHGQEMAENIKDFTENLADIGFDVELQDGSTYEMDKMESHAVLLKYGDDWEEFLPALASKVAEHYEKETEPTKFTEYASWGASDHDASKDEYETHAELAPIVAYADLRSAKMQLSLMAMSGPDEDTPSVVGISEDTITKYTDQGRITVELDGGDTDE